MQTQLELQLKNVIENSMRKFSEEELICMLLDPIEHYKKCLYIRKTEYEQICYFKGVKIKLSKTLFEALFKMAEDTTRYWLFSTDRKEVDCVPDIDRKRINRIKEKFKEAGFSADFIKSKEGFGYRIDTNILPLDLIVVSKK